MRVRIHEHYHTNLYIAPIHVLFHQAMEELTKCALGYIAIFALWLPLMRFSMLDFHLAIEELTKCALGYTNTITLYHPLMRFSMLHF